MAVLALWFPSVGTFGVLLAVAAFVAPFLDLKGRQRIAAVLLSAIFGAGELVSIVMAEGAQKKTEAAHKEEVSLLQKNIDDLKDQAARSDAAQEAREAYLTAKLEDYVAFEKRIGPRLVKLALASQEYARKQFETQKLTDKELYDQTMDVVKRIRDFSVSREKRRDELFAAERMAATNLPPGQSDQAWRNYSDEIERQYSDDSDTWARRILGDAVFVTRKLEERLQVTPNSTQGINVRDVLSGNLAGARPELDLANYLEQAAKALAPRPGIQ